MSKKKLVLMDGNERRKDIKTDIIKFIEKGWLRNKETSLSDIQSVFQKTPYSLSYGTIRNILDELIKERKISTWKIGKNRYYGPPKLPLSLKFGGVFAIIIISMSVIIDILFDSTYIFSQFGASSFIAYSLILIAICVAFAYRIERKLYK